MSSVRRSPRTGKTNSHRPRPASHSTQLFEPLEARQLLSAATALVNPAVGGTLPAAGPAPTGLTPTQIRHAYGFDQITGTGAGQTIAIVDAFRDPTIVTDLQAFDAQFGLTDPVIDVLDQTGKHNFRGPAYQRTDEGWAGETALDVEWAHVVAPDAKIVLVSSEDNNMINLFAAVNVARYLPGVSAISMSWGARENPGNGDAAFQGIPDDFYFNRFLLAPAGHQPETFIAAAGDSGVAGAGFPATSPYVLSVGGTFLQLDSSNNYLSESVWIGSQGGQSNFEPKPAYQSAIKGVRNRAVPDVSYNADPASGVPVYNSTSSDPLTPIPVNLRWTQVGGTSAGSPQWAGLIADINEMRVSAGLQTLNGVNETLPALYQLAQQKKTRYLANFNDIATGQNGNIVASELPTTPVPLNTVPNPRGGGFTGIPATPGYDMATGLGTPKVPSLSFYLSTFVPQKVVHRSARRRAAAAAATRAAQADAAKMAKSSGSTSMTAYAAFAMVAGDEMLASGVVAPVAAPTAPAAAVAVPPAFVVKHLDASVAQTAYGVTLAVSTDGTVTTQSVASSELTAVASPAEVGLTGAFLTAAPVMATDDTSTAQPAAATEQQQQQPAAPVQTAPAVPAAPAQTPTTPAPAAVPPASEQAPAAVPAEEGASSQNVEAQVVIDGAVATATAGETAAKKPTEHTKAFKPSVPMLAGVVAADAVVLGKWFQRRAEAKRRKAQAARFGLTLVTPQDDDQVC